MDKEEMENRRNLIDNARNYILCALRCNVEIINTLDIHNDFDFNFINDQIDDTIKLLQLLKIRFINSEDLK